jgi:hypothetical protein
VRVGGHDLELGRNDGAEALLGGARPSGGAGDSVGHGAQQVSEQERQDFLFAGE